MTATAIVTESSANGNGQAQGPSHISEAEKERIYGKLLAIAEAQKHTEPPYAIYGHRVNADRWRELADEVPGWLDLWDPTPSKETVERFELEYPDLLTKVETAQKKAKQAEEEGIVKQLADAICETNDFAQDQGGRLYRFSDGVYRHRGEAFVRAQVKRLLVSWDESAQWSTRRASEVVEYIRVDCPQLWERPPRDVLNVLNGLLRLEDSVLLPHNPSHLSPVQLPIKFDPTATCPAIEKFVGEVFPADAHSLAWEIPGWLMVPNLSIQKAVLLTGEGSNGKSVYLNMVRCFLGPQNTSALSLHKLEADRFAVGRLVGKLANICPDLPSEHLSGTSTFKSLVGGDTLTGEFKFKGSFDFIPYVRLVFSCNHPPKSQDGSHAFFRRWIVVPFDRTFSEDQQTPRDVLDARLTTPAELSGLLNHAIAALERLGAQRGFSEPPSVEQAWIDFHATTSPFAVWLDRYTIDDPDVFVVKKTLRIAYTAAAERSGRPSMGTKAFGTALYRLRPQVIEAQRTVNGKYQWCYVGIGLTHDDDASTRNTRDARDYPLINHARGKGNTQGGAQARTAGEVNMGESSVSRASRDRGAGACQHLDIEETPTRDGFINRQCKVCGERLTCRKATK